MTTEQKIDRVGELREEIKKLERQARFFYTDSFSLSPDDEFYMPPDDGKHYTKDGMSRIRPYYDEKVKLIKELREIGVDV